MTSKEMSFDPSVNTKYQLLFNVMIKHYYINENTIINTKKFPSHFARLGEEFDELLTQLKTAPAGEKHYSITTTKISKMGFGIEKYLNQDVDHNQYELIVKFGEFQMSLADSLFNYPVQDDDIIKEKEIVSNLTKIGNNYSIFINACIDVMDKYLLSQISSTRSRVRRPEGDKILSRTILPSPIITYN